MRWECAECGGQTRGQRRPEVCPLCGTGGALFIVPEIEAEQGGEEGGLRMAWLEYGMSWSGAPARGGESGSSSPLGSEPSQGA
jgi:hypothetical protein